jgi:hypothetical protein
MEFSRRREKFDHGVIDLFALLDPRLHRRLRHANLTTRSRPRHAGVDQASARNLCSSVRAFGPP